MSRAAPVCLILLCSAVAPRALADGRATRTPPPAAYVERTVWPGAFGAIITTSRSARGCTWP